MALNAQLFSGVLAATDTVAFTTPAGQVAKVTSITLEQPAGSVSATISIALNGTSLTAANVRRSILTTAGQFSTEIFPGFVLPAGATINVSSTTATQNKLTINGTKDLVA